MNRTTNHVAESVWVDRQHCSQAEAEYETARLLRACEEAARRQVVPTIVTYKRPNEEECAGVVYEVFGLFPSEAAAMAWVELMQCVPYGWGGDFHVSYLSNYEWFLYVTDEDEDEDEPANGG